MLSENEAKTTEILLVKDGNVESSFQKKSCPIENTRKMYNLNMPPLIAKIRQDVFVKMKIRGHCICREYSQVKHIKI